MRSPEASVEATKNVTRALTSVVAIVLIPSLKVYELICGAIDVGGRFAGNGAAVVNDPVTLIAVVYVAGQFPIVQVVLLATER